MVSRTPKSMDDLKIIEWSPSPGKNKWLEADILAARNTGFTFMMLKIGVIVPMLIKTLNTKISWIWHQQQKSKPHMQTFWVRVGGSMEHQRINDKYWFDNSILRLIHLFTFYLH